MEEIAERIFVETGFDGVNVGAILTDEGIICIDTPSYPRDARNWSSYVERRFARPIRYLILTDCHGDRILNARWINAPIVTHQFSSDRMFGYEKRYPQNLLDSLIQRNPLSGRELTSNPVDRPSLSFTDFTDIISEDQLVTVQHHPGPSPGTSWARVVSSNVLFVGDSVISGIVPSMSDMLWKKWLSSLESLLEEVNHSDILIVPGRGALGVSNLIETMISFLKTTGRMVQQYIDVGNPRESLEDCVDDVMLMLANVDLPGDWSRTQISMGLMRLYDELTNSITNAAGA